ncbi:MAG: hypothetical protein LAP85_12325 [Acidobacteriia bacterium]|nr:hypothetical protein [Terriglobia bacterium]
MKRSLILLASLTLFLGAFAEAAEKAQKKVNFSGTWIFEKNKVEQAPGAQRGGAGGMGRGGGRGGRTGGQIPGGRYPGGGRTGGGRGGNDPGSAARLTDSALIISQTDTELKVTHKVNNPSGPQQELVQVFKLDGSESVNRVLPAGGELRSRTSWNKDKLVTLGTQQPSSSSDDAARLDIVIKQEFSLSKDGKILTLKTSRSMARGQITTTETFTRQTDTQK